MPNLAVDLLIVGAGPTGLLLAQLIATGGASSVTVAAPSRFKLDTAAGLGIDRTVQISRDEAHELELERGQIVYVRPLRERTFAED